jgi:nitrate reductase NapAB chaperone NapD
MNKVGMLVRVSPDALESIARKIEDLPGALVYSVGRDGCLSVSLLQSERALLADAMVSIQNLEGVISTALLFQQYDEDNRER